LTFVSCDEYGVYPSTWPFTYPSLELPASVPDNTLTTSDPGGYHYHGMVINDYLNNQTAPLINSMPFMSGYYYLYHSLTGLYQWNNPLSQYNCTKYYYDSTLLGGVVNSVQICKAPNCCPHYANTNSYLKQDLNYLQNLQTLMGSILTSGACNVNNLKEIHYCQFMNYFPSFCIQYFISRSKRIFIQTCIDVDYNYYIDCPLIRSTGYSAYIVSTWKTEPPAYASKCSIVQSVLIYFMDNARHFDRICHPLSYFNPNTNQSPSPSPSLVSSTSSFRKFCGISFFLFVVILL